MPQMAPMMWLTLMLFFIITMIIMMTFNYFLTQPTPYHSKTIIDIKSTENDNKPIFIIWSPI